VGARSPSLRHRRIRIRAGTVPCLPPNSGAIYRPAKAGSARGYQTRWSPKSARQAGLGGAAAAKFALAPVRLPAGHFGRDLPARQGPQRTRLQR
jgi:hypothetical protein